MEEVFHATLNHELSLSGGNVRKFLLSATAGVDLGDQAEMVTKLFAALDKIEAQSGSVTAENTAALQAFEKEVAVRIFCSETAYWHLFRASMTHQ